MAKRCPNGSRKNRKTGNCVRKTGTVLGRPSSIRKTKKRCPNGTRKHRKTGNCVGIRKRSASPMSFYSARSSSSPSIFYTPLENDGKVRMNVNRAT